MNKNANKDLSVVESLASQKAGRKGAGKGKAGRPVRVGKQ